jgi:Domain of unknown function (DUF4440)
MVVGARTPEELETLLEDAFVTRDRDELGALFTEGAVLASRSGDREARGGDAIGRAVTEADGTYVAGTRRVLQSRGLALVVADAGIHVVRRCDDGAWRAAISLLDLVETTEREDA